MNTRKQLLLSASVVAIVGGGPGAAHAQDAYSWAGASGPAVSAPNGKAGAFIGSTSGDFTLGATGSFAVPLGAQWGAQIDGMLGSAGGGAFYGVGGHVFWRDPSRGLIGGYASWVGWAASGTNTLPLNDWDETNQLQDYHGASVGTVGLETAAYLGRISLEGAAGVQFGDNSGIKARGAIAFYPTDDLRIDVGLSHLVGQGLTFRAGTEWAPGGRNFSLFANAAASTTDNWSVLGGAKIYFGGQQKSLINRHREDDPENLLPEDLYTIVGESYCPVGYEMLDGFCDSNS